MSRTLLSLAPKLLAVPLALAASAAGMYTLVKVEQAHGNVALAAEPPAAEVVPNRVESAAPTMRREDIQLGALAPVAPHEGVAPTVDGEAAATLIKVPDFTGKRLGQVRREAKKLGLKIAARDEYGERVPADLAPYYRVRKQLTAADTEVAPGSTVQVKVREVAGYASGY